MHSRETHAHNKKLSVSLSFLCAVLGAKVSVDAGCEERACEVLEAAGAVNGGQPALFLSAHPVCQSAEEGRTVCVGPCAAGRSG